jgi:hypothetical protein
MFSFEEIKFDNSDAFEDGFEYIFDDYSVRADEILEEGYYLFPSTEALANNHSTYLPLMEQIHSSIKSHENDNEETTENSDYSRVMELKTSGEIENNCITYGESGSEMCLCVGDDWATLERKDREGICLFFEKGKRSRITIGNRNNIHNGIESPVMQLCLETYEIKNNLNSENPFVEIYYSVDINGFISERTRFLISVKGEISN